MDLQSELLSRQGHWARQLFEAADGAVLSGPFAAMRLIESISWGSGDVSSKILGCYEQELHQSIEKAIARRPDTVINIGCAEGYYAVGLARRLPAAITHAFDISPEAQAVCASAAKLNGVADRVVIGGECSRQELIRLTRGDNKKLIVMDCEGAELQLLDESVVDGMENCDLIVECHDFVDRGITPTLTRRLGARHDVDVVREGGRNPSAYPFLSTLGTFDRWLVVCEFRPEVMSWLACWSRRDAG